LFQNGHGVKYITLCNGKNYQRNTCNTRHRNHIDAAHTPLKTSFSTKKKMEWNALAKKINEYKDKFEKSYKCINSDKTIKSDTLIHHAQILTAQYNNIVKTINKVNAKLTQEHENQCQKIIKTLRTRLHNICILGNPNQLAEFDENQLQDLDESKPIFNSDSDSDIETLQENTDITMAS